MKQLFLDNVNSYLIHKLKAWKQAAPVRVSWGHQHSAVTFRWHNGTKPVRLIQGHEGTYLTPAQFTGRWGPLCMFSHIHTILPLRTQCPSSVPPPLAVSLQLLTSSSRRTSPSALVLLAQTLYLKNLQSPNLPTWTLCPPGLHRAGLLCFYTELLSSNIDLISSELASMWL